MNKYYILLMYFFVAGCDPAILLAGASLVVQVTDASRHFNDGRPAYDTQRQRKDHPNDCIDPRFTIEDLNKE